MPTDGADFKRRVRYHGRTYTEIKNGSDVATVASFSVAGLARELLGDNPLPGFRKLVLATVESLQGIFGRDRSFLLQELRVRLLGVSSEQEPSEALRITQESLIREAGRISGEMTSHDSEALVGQLLASCGQDLHEALVMDQAGDYAKHHRDLSDQSLIDFVDSWKNAASETLTELMRSVFEKGRPDRSFTSPRRGLAPVNAGTLEDLTSIDLTL